jgi:hypothetical protein
MRVIAPSFGLMAAKSLVGRQRLLSVREQIEEHKVEPNSRLGEAVC